MNHLQKAWVKWDVHPFAKIPTCFQALHSSFSTRHAAHQPAALTSQCSVSAQINPIDHPTTWKSFCHTNPLDCIESASYSFKRILVKSQPSEHTSAQPPDVGIYYTNMYSKDTSINTLLYEDSLCIGHSTSLIFLETGWSSWVWEKHLTDARAHRHQKPLNSHINAHFTLIQSHETTT